MSIKFKQNGQWVKIPTPSQIDDSAASATTTYSSNKINEIIPQDIAKYLLEHKDELGTDDFTKLKNVPFTTINTTNKSEFTTLKGILDHSDGMYLVDDCGVTNGDEQLTIASFKGHCSTMLMASIAQFKEVTDSEEIRCYKGSTIYILTEGDISNGATRYVSICNVPMGVSGEGEPSSPDRTFPDAGTSIINIEIHPVEDRSSGKPVYSYDIDGGTGTLFTHPGYESILSSYATALVAGGMITGKSSYSPGQLIQVIEDKDAWSGGGCIFTGVDASEFKSPITVINNENATNYNTLDKLCHLEDGLYLCKDNYKANQDYIVDITFKGIDIVQSVGAMYGGTEPTPESTMVRCKNGCLISVSSITSLHKNIRITQSAETISNDNDFCGDIYISAQADSGGTENPVYGVTGDSVNYIRPFNYTSLLNTYFPSAVLGNAFGSEAQNLNGKLAKWQTSGSGVILTGADIKESPIIEVNDSNWSNFDTLQKWFAAEPGVYYINCTPVKTTINGIERVESYKTISAGFHFSDYMGNQGNTVTVADGQIHLPYKGLVYVTSTDQTGGGWYRDLHIYLPQVSSISGTGISYGNVSTQSLDFTYSLIHGAATSANVTAANVELTDLGSGANAIAYMSEIMSSLTPIVGYFESLKSSDIGKLVKVASPSSSDYGNEYELQATDITLTGNSTAITPAQVLAAVNEGKTTTITHTDATQGTFKFTSFGVVSAASGDTVSSSITYGTSADSLTLYTLIGDVTKGTWTLYSKNLTVSA